MIVLIYFFLAILVVLVVIYFIYKNKIQFNFSVNIQPDLKDQVRNNNTDGSKINSAEIKEIEENWKFCFDTLKNVSRSFNIVIKLLDDDMIKVICIFYLVLRGLDTIEDDMNIPIEDKKRMLLNFHNDIENEDFSMECGDKPEYKILMKHFSKVNKSYKQLHSKYRDVIKNITIEMAKGMVEFLDKPSMETTQEYDSYCHYVAGLVGIGLSQIFTLSGTEFNDLSQHDNLSNSMGVFLQKTNIIRDIKEDHDEKRYWWPKDIVSKHFSDIDDIFINTDNIGDTETKDKYTNLLNEMVMNALRHIPECIEYLSIVKNNNNFKFCAIPQVVAVQTLATLFNNTDVFKKTEKLNKTTLARIFIDVNDINSVLQFYIDAIEKIEHKILINKDRTKSSINVEELDKIKAFIVKYVIDHSNKSTNISLKKVKKSVISTCISLFQKNILYPLSNM